MLGLIPNFLSRLRKKRRWCAFFSTASVWADHVRSSVMWTQRNLKLFYPLHRCLVDGDGCVFSALSPEIHHQLLGLVDVEWEVVLLAPFSQGTHLLSVGRLIVSVIRPVTVVSSANLTMTLELCVAVQSCVYRQYRSGLRTQPCGAPVLRIRGDEVLLPILTTWLLPVRKSRIQLHRDLFSPRVWSFSTSVAGTMVVKWLNYNPRTASLHRCSYFPGGREQCAGWRQ